MQASHRCRGDLLIFMSAVVFMHMHLITNAQNTTSLTQCIDGLELEVAPPTTTTDRTCRTCDTCDAENEYISNQCKLDQNTNTSCAPKRDCVEGVTYQLYADSDSIKRDRTCTVCKACSNREFIQQLCQPHFGGNTVCSPLLTCTSTEYESVAPTLTSDRSCAPCNTCDVDEVLVGKCTPNSPAICKPKSDGCATSVVTQLDTCETTIAAIQEGRFNTLPDLSDQKFGKLTSTQQDPNKVTTSIFATGAFAGEIDIELFRMRNEFFVTVIYTGNCSSNQRTRLTEFEIECLGSGQCYGEYGGERSLEVPVDEPMVFIIYNPDNNEPTFCAETTTTLSAIKDADCSHDCPRGQHVDVQRGCCVSCIVCERGSFTSGGCVGSQDTQCTNTSSCTATEFVKTPHTPMRDTECAECSICGGSTMVGVECNGTRDTVCIGRSECVVAAEFEITFGDTTTDRRCSNCTTCADDEYIARLCTGVFDTVCAAISECSNDEYANVASTPTSDRQCQQCSVCLFEEFQSCSATQDAQCGTSTTTITTTTTTVTVTTATTSTSVTVTSTTTAGVGAAGTEASEADAGTVAGAIVGVIIVLILIVLIVMFLRNRDDKDEKNAYGNEASKRMDEPLFVDDNGDDSHNTTANTLYEGDNAGNIVSNPLFAGHDDDDDHNQDQAEHEQDQQQQEEEEEEKAKEGKQDLSGYEIKDTDVRAMRDTQQQRLQTFLAEIEKERSFIDNPELQVQHELEQRELEQQRSDGEQQHHDDNDNDNENDHNNTDNTNESESESNNNGNDINADAKSMYDNVDFSDGTENPESAELQDEFTTLIDTNNDDNNDNDVNDNGDNDSTDNNANADNNGDTHAAVASGIVRRSSARKIFSLTQQVVAANEAEEELHKAILADRKAKLEASKKQEEEDRRRRTQEELAKKQAKADRLFELEMAAQIQEEERQRVEKEAQVAQFAEEEQVRKEEEHAKRLEVIAARKAREEEARLEAERLVAERKHREAEAKQRRKSAEFIPCTNMINCPCHECAADREDEAKRLADRQERMESLLTTNRPSMTLKGPTQTLDNRLTIDSTATEHADVEPTDNDENETNADNISAITTHTLDPPPATTPITPTTPTTPALAPPPAKKEETFGFGAFFSDGEQLSL